jgi:hypothetical protein
MSARIGTLKSVNILVSCLLALVLSTGHNIASEAKDISEKEIEKIVGPEECGECHKAEVHTWRQTKHFKTYKEMPRKKKAKEIAGKMNIKRMKKDSACLTCHFTFGYKKEKIKAIAGISCESCHSPAKEWIKVHGDYGGKKVTREKETPEHKKKRLAAIQESGMIRPSNLYRLAENCFQCHTVPNEKLVNTGGHKAGSEFDLVAWSQGEVRHNFSRSQGKKNQEASPERKRLLYVIGGALDLEFSMRSLAKATEKGKFADAMAKRVQDSMSKLNKANTLAPIPEIEEMLTIAGNVKLIPNQEAMLNTASDKVAISTRKMSEGYDGSKWAALDQLLPKVDKYKGKPGEAPPGK